MEEGREMKLFNIFKKQKAKTIKELYTPVLDQMWVCVFDFAPWSEERHQVMFKKVNIVKAYADEKGIFVESNEQDPFSTYDNRCLCGYIDTIFDHWHWTGFFETKEEAEKAYNDLMKKWIGVIESKMVGAVDLKEVMK
jgi:hypothetical protein